MGLPHPLDGLIPEGPLIAMARLFLLVEILTIATGLLAVSGPAHRHLLFWVPTLHFYFPLGVLAVYKALYELIFAPFFWDKTAHGQYLPAEHLPVEHLPASPVGRAAAIPPPLPWPHLV